MSTNIDIRNEAAGIEDVLDYISQPEAEREEVENKNEARLEARADISKTKKILKKIKKLLEEGHLSETDQAKTQELIDYLNQVIDAHKEIYQSLTHALKNGTNADPANPTNVEEPEEASEINFDGQDGSPVFISSQHLASGKDVIVQTAPQAFDPFAQSEMTDEEKLLKYGVINEQGEVIKDIDDNGIYNAQDKSAALNKMREEEIGPDIQSVNLQLYKGEIVDLASFDSESGTAVFRIEREDGVTFVTIEHASGVILNFSGGQVNHDETWPHDLKIRIKGEVMGAEYEEPTDSEKLNSIPGRQAFLSRESTTEAKKHITEFEASEAQLENLRKKYGDVIFRALANFVSQNDDPHNFTKFAEIWKNDVIKALQNEGLAPRDIANVLNMLIVTLVNSLPLEQFQAITDSASITLLEEAILGTDKIGVTPQEGTAHDKLSIIILEYTATNEGGYFYGNDVFIKAFAVDKNGDIIPGLFRDNSTNIEALNMAKELFEQQGLGFPPEAREAFKAEEVILYGPPLDISPSTFKLLSDNIDAIVNKWFDPKSRKDDIARKDINQKMKEWLDALKKSNGQSSYEFGEMLLHDSSKPIIKALFVILLGGHLPGLLAQLARKRGFVKELSSTVSNDFDDYNTIPPEKLNFGRSPLPAAPFGPEAEIPRSFRQAQEQATNAHENLPTSPDDIKNEHERIKNEIKNLWGNRSQKPKGPTQDFIEVNMPELYIIAFLEALEQATHEAQLAQHDTFGYFEDAQGLPEELPEEESEEQEEE